MHTDISAHSVSQLTLGIQDDGLKNKEVGRELFLFPMQLLRNKSYQWKAARQNGRKQNKMNKRTLSKMVVKVFVLNYAYRIHHHRIHNKNL